MSKFLYFQSKQICPIAIVINRGGKVNDWCSLNPQ